MRVIDRDLLRSPERATADVIRTADRSLGIPEDLLRTSVVRLRQISLIYAAVYLLQYLITTLLAPNLIELQRMLVYEAPWGRITAVFVAVSLGVAWLAGKVPLNFVPDLGLIYMVIGAAGIEIGLLWIPRPDPLLLLSMSYVVVWLAMFALIVPTSPGKMLFAAIVAASIRLLFLLVLAARGQQLPAPPLLMLVMTPNLVGVVLAVFGSTVFYSLGRDVDRARRMGSYQLIEPIASGGMGEVWSAEHHLLARRAAIKLIRPAALGQADPDGRRLLLARFEREVQATATLSSPHTVQIHDFGVTADATFYYVMELLKGLDTDSLIERFGPVPPARAAYILAQVCDSLSEAHDLGLVHRDIKPANVFLCRRGVEADFVKVLDFGLVKAAAGSGHSQTALTQQHVATGTPAFMAPEVAVGEAGIDARTDLYSVGCLAYWLLTGRLVFEDGSAVQVMLAHASREPERMSRRTEQPIPPELEDVVMSCLAKDPGGRPESADSLRRSLLEICYAEPWDRDIAAAWWRTHLPEGSS